MSLSVCGAQGQRINGKTTAYHSGLFSKHRDVHHNLLAYLLTADKIPKFWAENCNCAVGHLAPGARDIF